MPREVEIFTYSSPPFRTGYTNWKNKETSVHIFNNSWFHHFPNYLLHHFWLVSHKAKSYIDLTEEEGDTTVNKAPSPAYTHTPAPYNNGKQTPLPNNDVTPSIPALSENGQPKAAAKVGVQTSLTNNGDATMLAVNGNTDRASHVNEKTVQRTSPNVNSTQPTNTPPQSPSPTGLNSPASTNPTSSSPSTAPKKGIIINLSQSAQVFYFLPSIFPLFSHTPFLETQIHSTQHVRKQNTTAPDRACAQCTGCRVHVYGTGGKAQFFSSSHSCSFSIRSIFVILSSYVNPSYWFLRTLIKDVYISLRIYTGPSATSIIHRSVEFDGTYARHCA